MIRLSILFLFWASMADAVCLHVMKADKGEWKRGDVITITDGCTDQPYDHKAFVLVRSTNTTVEEVKKFITSDRSYSLEGKSTINHRRKYNINLDSLPAEKLKELKEKGNVLIDFNLLKPSVLNRVTSETFAEETAIK